MTTQPPPEPAYPCPSCGFLTFAGPPGSFDICELCNWEDDHVQLRFPTMGGGANRLSLVMYQSRSIERWPFGVQAIGELPRDPGWRPWRPEDAAAERAASVPGSGLAYFDEAGEDDAAPYYWRRSTD